MKQYLRTIKNSPFGYQVREKSFNLFEFLTNNYYERKTFRIKTGYKLNLKNPQTFCEKICWRKFYDRKPVYTRIVDKYEVRNFLKEILGEEEAEKVLIPLLYVTDDPETIPFDDLPDEYIIKANHGSGTNIIVRKDDSVDRKDIIKTCKHWLALPHGFEKHEWAYKNIPRKIVIEKLILDENGNLPNDYKYHMFHGKCAQIQYIEDRHSSLKNDETFTLVDTDWNKINVFWNKPSLDEIPKPDNSDEMLQLAEKLSASFGYIRVDLYSISGKTYFGELTLYPASGKFYVDPLSYCYELGDKWNL